MSERIQRRRSRQATNEAQAADASAAPARQTTASAGQKVDYDALLAEIDGVLEADAEEYVRSFVQKGGQ